MPWFYVDDAFADSKPVMRLDQSFRNAAIGLWVRCGAWSAKEETDGHVPLDVVRQFDGTPRLIRALCNIAELWTETCPNSDQISVENRTQSANNPREILFNNWAKWQKTHAELAAKRRSDAERQKAYRRKGRNAVTSEYEEMSRCDYHVTNDERHAVTNERVTPAVTRNVTHNVTRESSRARARRPDPTRPLVVTKGEGTNVSNGTPSPPPRFCSEHMPDGTDESCGACGEHRRRRDAWDSLQARRAEQEAARARVAEQQASVETKLDSIDNCAMCDKYGYRPNSLVCDHIDRTETAARGIAKVRESLGKKFRDEQ